MKSIVRQFEEDCLARIENLRTGDEEGLPRPTIFLMGLGFGVIAARIACTCAELRR